MKKISEADHDKFKAEYMAEGRTYCRHCGNSDVEMEDLEADMCYWCLHPKELQDMQKSWLEDYLYVYGED